MVLEIDCLGDDACCQKMNRLSVTSATSAGSTLAPRSEHGLLSPAFGSRSDGSWSDASLEGEAVAWPVAMADDGDAPLEPLEFEAPPWPVTVAVDDYDDYDPRDARFVREASDSSIAECGRKILDDQIAGLDAFVRRRSPQGEASSALAHYSAVLRELREEASADVAMDSGGAASASAALPARPRVRSADLGLAPFTMDKGRTSRPCIPLLRAPWVAHDALDSSPLGGLLEDALFGKNSPRRSRTPRRAAHGAGGSACRA